MPAIFSAATSWLTMRSKIPIACSCSSSPIPIPLILANVRQGPALLLILWRIVASRRLGLLCIGSFNGLHPLTSLIFPQTVMSPFIHTFLSLLSVTASTSSMWKSGAPCQDALPHAQERRARGVGRVIFILDLGIKGNERRGKM